uniref:Uncharacterized protein n=1 Tax=Calcidiscus leptoporus TaxID=127549 RepID=A0A7S0JBM4_9EUKA|mmetsp:Transcript_48367/g.112008  ORF Transcript_48367/g.112008 Transcript_48367/m.112008 type:complete len:170 (+) Transcript_48367:49-558(+)
MVTVPLGTPSAEQLKELRVARAKALTREVLHAARESFRRTGGAPRRHSPLHPYVPCLSLLAGRRIIEKRTGVAAPTTKRAGGEPPSSSLSEPPPIRDCGEARLLEKAVSMLDSPELLGLCMPNAVPELAELSAGAAVVESAASVALHRERMCRSKNSLTCLDALLQLHS